MRERRWERPLGILALIRVFEVFQGRVYHLWTLADRFVRIIIRYAIQLQVDM